MLVETKAIVLNQIRFSEKDLIVKCYTLSYGIKSYLVRGALKSKGRGLKRAYFLPFSLLEIQADHKDKRSLQYIREAKVFQPTDSIHSNVIKGSITLFLTELLSNTLKEEEANKDLYEFLETAILWLENHVAPSHFHIVFLLQLTKYLGFYPDLTGSGPYFDLLEGKRVQSLSSPYCITGEQFVQFQTALGTNFDVDNKLQMTAVQKRETLDMILLYFKLHLDGFKEPNSLAVFYEVFN